MPAEGPAYSVHGIVATDEVNDLAVLSIDAGGVQPLPLATDDAPDRVLGRSDNRLSDIKQFPIDSREALIAIAKDLLTSVYSDVSDDAHRSLNELARAQESQLDLATTSHMMYSASEFRALVREETANFEAAQAGIRRDPIDHLVAAHELEGERVEMRVGGRPRSRLGKVADQRSAAGGRALPYGGAIGQADAEAQRFAVAGEARRGDVTPALEIRDDVHVLDMRRRHGFEPHGLPDAGGSRVPRREGLVERALLSQRLHARSGVVFGADDQLVVSGLEGIGNVEVEGRASAAVRAHQRRQRGWSIRKAKVAARLFHTPSPFSAVTLKT